MFAVRALLYCSCRLPNTPRRFALGARDVRLVGDNPAVLRPSIVETRGSTVIRLRLCMKLLHPHPPPRLPIPSLSLSVSALVLTPPRPPLLCGVLASNKPAPPLLTSDMLGFREMPAQAPHHQRGVGWVRWLGGAPGERRALR